VVRALVTGDEGSEFKADYAQEFSKKLRPFTRWELAVKKKSAITPQLHCRWYELAF